MALLGGTFVAVSNLPPLLASVSLFTPNGLAQRGFTELSLGTADLAGIWWVPAGLLAMAAVSGGVAVAVIRRRVLA
jgi:ABC-type multidrug transport system permease subunit